MRGKITVKAFGRTDPGKVRANNEDALCIADLVEAAASSGGATLTEALTFDATERAVLLAVSDGVGGGEAGEVASALVVETLRRAMQEAGGDVDWSEATKRAVERANREVWAASKAPDKRGMGATVTAVCIHGDAAHIAEVGDSRAYILRGGRLRQITKDQSFVQYLIDAGAISAEEAAEHNMRNVVLQAMGQNPDVQVALGKLELRRGDRILICSDGLSGPVSSTEMIAAVQQAETLEEACTTLIDRANEHGGPDNVTVVLASIDGDGLSPPREQESVTQTLKVVQEYTGVGARFGRRAHDADEEAPEAEDEAPEEAPAAAPMASPPTSKVDPKLVLAAAVVGLLVFGLVLLLERF